MFTHHSHSGQFCQHAEGLLEEMVQQAISLGFTTMCLTEHIPRLEVESLYPEEVESKTSLEDLRITFDNYIQEAVAVREKYADKIDLFIGFESETITEDYFSYINHTLQPKHPFDLWLGSVHHLLKIPIDSSYEDWLKILEKCNNDVSKVLGLYFDMQYKNLVALNPPVVAHFDLIRLFAPKGLVPDDLRSLPDIWAKIQRNLDYVKKIGGMVEINTSAIRKGWDCPYPQKDIAKEIVDSGIHICLSDDSHKTAQIGLNYRPSIEYLENLGASTVYYITKDGKNSISLEALKQKPFYRLTSTS